MHDQGVRMTVFAASDVGKKRHRNEDAFVVADMKQTVPRDATAAPTTIEVGSRGALLAVADGMGGAPGGEIASALTLGALRDGLAEAAMTTAETALQWAVERANEKVFRAAEERGMSGMGATLTAVLVYGQGAYIAEIGDSRAYLLRDGRLVQLTRDQSCTALLIRAGILTLESAKHFPFRHVVAQAVGPKPNVVVALSRVSLRRGDRLLVCSDGLSRKVSDAEIESALAPRHPLDAACWALIRRANDLGGEDNITVVVAECSGRGLALPKGRASVETLKEFTG